MSRSNDRIVAFLIGAVVGGVAALLLAPASGAETRRRIRETSESVLRQGKHRVQGVGEAARSQIRRMQEAARREAEAVRTAVDEGTEAYRREAKKDS